MKKYSLLSLSVAVLTACAPIVEPVIIVEPTPWPTDVYGIIVSENPTMIGGDTVKIRIDKGLKESLLSDKASYPEAFFLVGDQVVGYKEPKLHTPPVKDPDLSKIKNNDDPDLKGKPLRMVAIGGSLTAGVRDGGYFNEGILTSFPNLIARQMKLKKFEQPLFEGTDYNGFGRKVLTDFNPTGGPAPKFKAVSNNSAFTGEFEEKLPKLKKYNGLVDNWSYPYNGSSGFELPWLSKGPYYGRIEPVDKKEKYIVYSEQLLKEKFDFFLLEKGWSADGVFRSTQSLVRNGFPNPIENLLKEYRKRNYRGVIMNSPDFWDFPLNTVLKPEMILKVPDFAFRFSSLYSPTGVKISNFVIRPNSTIDSVLSEKVHVTLKPQKLPSQTIIQEVVVLESKNSLSEENSSMLEFSQKYNYPLVDFYSIFKKIFRGEYITDDGVRVDGKYPTGNFFSSDMMLPTAFGQAVIANEVIKTMNGFYKTEIPLIPTREYLQVK